MERKMNILPYASGVAYATIFGFSFLMSRMGLDRMELFHFLGLRFLIASLSMTLLIIARVIKVDFRGKNLKLAIYLGLLQPFVYMICEATSITLIPSSQVGIMIAIIPIFVIVFSRVFLKEYITVRQGFFVALSVSGVIFLVLMQSGLGGDSNILGYLAALAAVISAAGFNVYSRRLSQEFTPFELTYVIMVVGALLFNIIGIVRYSQLGQYSSYLAPLTDSNILVPLLYLAILSSAVAFGLVNYTLSQIAAAQASVFANLVTIISIIAGVIINGEAFFWYHLLGALMILLGVWGVNRFVAQEVPESLEGSSGSFH